MGELSWTSTNSDFRVGKSCKDMEIRSIILFITVLVASFLVNSTDASKGCKCRFSSANEKVTYHANHCKRGYRPQHQLVQLPNYPNDALGVTRIVCECKCGITEWHRIELIRELHRNFFLRLT